MLLNLPTSRCRLIFSSHYKSSWIGWKNLFILSSLRSAEIPCLLRWKKLTELQSQFLFEMLCRVMLLLENSIQAKPEERSFSFKVIFIFLNHFERNRRSDVPEVRDRFQINWRSYRPASEKLAILCHHKLPSSFKEMVKLCNYLCPDS